MPGAGVMTWNGYRWTRPESVLLPGGATKSYAYDPLMRVKEIQAKDKDGGVLMNFGYKYDKMDNIIRKSTEQGNYAYGYDDLYRLVTADNPALQDEGFSYDPVGNRLTDTQKPGSWTYNDNNELLSAPFATFTYDENGSTIGKIENGVVWTYTYNVENRMVTAHSISTTAQYYYDPFGRRLSKTVNGVTTYFYYADEGLVAEIDASGNVTKTYGWKPGGTWGTDPLFMKTDGEYYYYHNDHLGAPQKITDIDGDTAWSATYTSFGSATIEQSSIITCNLRFPGQYFDAETGLHYNYFRYYDPSTGRYLRPDPIGLIGGINLYAYTNENPINKDDSLGLNTYINHINTLIMTGRIGRAIEYAKMIGTPKALDLMRQAQSLQRTIQSLIEKYPPNSFMCDTLAKKIAEAFRAAGANPQVIKIVDRCGAQIFKDNNGIEFAKTGFHNVVRVGDIIYDAFTGPTGMHIVDYMAKLESFGIIPLIEK